MAGSIPGPVEGFFGLENFSIPLGIEYHCACHTIYKYMHWWWHRKLSINNCGSASRTLRLRARQKLIAMSNKREKAVKRKERYRVDISRLMMQFDVSLTILILIDLKKNENFD